MRFVLQMQMAPDLSSISARCYILKMFTPEQKNRIAAALNARNPQPCSGCKQLQTLMVGDGFVNFPIQHAPTHFTLEGGNYACIPVICSFCGNVTFHNAFTLGLNEFLGLAQR
jgi:hypothetical protein